MIDKIAHAITVFRFFIASIAMQDLVDNLMTQHELLEQRYILLMEDYTMLAMKLDMVDKKAQQLHEHEQELYQQWVAFRFNEARDKWI